MEATMDAPMTHAVREPVGFGGAFARQFRLLWTSRRPLLLGLALLALLGLAGEPWSNDPKARLFTLWPLWLSLIGPVWAFAVFHNEGPSSRLYLWSLPVGRTRHTLARLAAGLAWLWILYAVLIGAGAVLASLDGDLWQLGTITAPGWINFFTGPLLGYLAISVLTIASDYPLRWFFGILFLFPLTVSILDDWLGLESLVDALVKPLTNEDWGLFPVMIGGLGGAINDLAQTLARMADPDVVMRGEFHVAYWGPATVGWIVILLGLVVYAASRHPDRLPRLRRSG